MDKLGFGKAVAITQQDIWDLGKSLRVDPPVIDGIGITESNGAGWFPNGQIKILPEPHKFYEYLPKAKKAEALKQGLATRTYKETKSSGHYKRMTNSPGPRYALLEKWIQYDEYAAYMAISTGSFQIMGFNFKECGFTSAKEMFERFCDSEAVQLKAFANFIVSKDGGLQALRNEDYAMIEELYNGGGQGGAYARKMKENVAKARSGRWINYFPSNQSPKKSESVQILKVGDASPEVEKAQHQLVKWGYDIQPDGKFGKLTKDAVEAFQAAHGLKVDGHIGENTRAVLFSEPSREVAKKIEEDIKPVVVLEEKTQTQLEPVVPKAVKKPWWKSWSMGGVGTIVGGWATSLMTDLEPWMKFTLLLIGIGIMIAVFWQRQKLFNEAKALINVVNDFNNDESVNTVTTVTTKT